MGILETLIFCIAASLIATGYITIDVLFYTPLF